MGWERRHAFLHAFRLSLSNFISRLFTKVSTAGRLISGDWNSCYEDEGDALHYWLHNDVAEGCLHGLLGVNTFPSILALVSR